jgi:cell shape-determining protein MreC
MRAAKNLQYLFYILSSLILFFLDSQGNLRFFHKAADNLITPVQAIIFEIKQAVLSPYVLLKEKKSLIEKIDLLEKEKANLSAKLAELGKVKEENEAAKRLLGAGLSSSWRFSPANVVYVGDDLLYVSSDYQVQQGMAAVIGDKEGVFVGKAQNIPDGRIEVLLPTNKKSKIPVVVQDKNTGERRATGIVEGRGKEAIITQVLQSETLQEEDLVVTSGDAGFPAGLLVGYVGKVFSNSQKSWQEAQIKIPIDVTTLKTVFFVSKY